MSRDRDRPLTDDRREAPAAARNREPILAVLAAHVGQGAQVLEIASGTGEHAVFLAPRLGVAAWWPSDPAPAARASIAAWASQSDVPMIRPPLDLDARCHVWPVPEEQRFDMIVSINMIHIAPWAAAEGLFHGAAKHVDPGGLIYLYGPFMRDGAHTAPSNADFDASLKMRDPAWGVRDLADVTDLAARNGFDPAGEVAMPANNLSVIFRRR